MYEKVFKGEKFRFLQETTAVALSNLAGYFLGFHAPGSMVKEEYGPKLLGEEIDVLTTDKFVAHNAYESVTGWCIVGHRVKVREDGIIEVHFHQKLSDDDNPNEFLEIQKI